MWFLENSTLLSTRSTIPSSKPRTPDKNVYSLAHSFHIIFLLSRRRSFHKIKLQIPDFLIPPSQILSALGVWRTQQGSSKRSVGRDFPSKLWGWAHPSLLSRICEDSGWIYSVRVIHNLVMAFEVWPVIVFAFGTDCSD